MRLVSPYPQVVLLAMQLPGSSYATTLLAVSLSTSLLASLNALLEMHWMVVLAGMRGRYARVLAMCMRYEGCSRPPLEWAEKVQAGKAQVLLNLGEAGFGALHR